MDSRWYTIPLWFFACLALAACTQQHTIDPKARDAADYYLTMCSTGNLGNAASATSVEHVDVTAKQIREQLESDDPKVKTMLELVLRHELQQLRTMDSVTLYAQFLKSVGAHSQTCRVWFRNGFSHSYLGAVVEGDEVHFAYRLSNPAEATKGIPILLSVKKVDGKWSVAPPYEIAALPGSFAQFCKAYSLTSSLEDKPDHKPTKEERELIKRGMLSPLMQVLKSEE